MADANSKLPLDARLLSYVIIELNISRRNVAIYPKNHPSVERSLTQAFDFLRQLFALRPEITLSIAKDTIIIDEFHLDKKNPVFTEFAVYLSKMNIASVTFKKGVSKDELYSFQSFIVQKPEDLTIDSLRNALKRFNLRNIQVSFIDFGSFAFRTGQSQTTVSTKEAPLWERYIYGLRSGALKGSELSHAVREIPPGDLGTLVNEYSSEDLKQDTYDGVITAYMRSSTHQHFHGQELKKMMEFIRELKPDLKQQFLSSAVRTFSRDTASAYQMLKEVSLEDIRGFLDAVNTQKISVPPALRNIMDSLSEKERVHTQTIRLKEGMMIDDIVLPGDSTAMLENGNFDPSLSDTYQQDVQKLLKVDASGLRSSQLLEFETEFYDDLVEKKFNQIILELLSSEKASEEDYRACADIMKEQSAQLLWIGEYTHILDMLRTLEINKALYRFPDISAEALRYFHSSDFFATLIDSFRILGRQKRKEVSMICEYYDKKIIPYIMDALTDEDSPVVRRFLMELLKQFGDKLIPEALKRLDDEKWFVKRNMLYILTEIDNQSLTEHIRPYCRHENPKVSLAAMKYLINAGDRYPIEKLREYLDSQEKEKFAQAVMLAGSFKVKELVGDLIVLLNKTEMTGADFSEKIPIVKALGEIGDPHAVAALRNLLSSRSLFFKGTTERLKEEIYKTLKNYPYDAVQDLIKAGLESKNDVIRTESKLLDRTD